MQLGESNYALSGELYECRYGGCRLYAPWPTSVDLSCLVSDGSNDLGVGKGWQQNSWLNHRAEPEVSAKTSLLQRHDHEKPRARLSISAVTVVPHCLSHDSRALDSESCAVQPKS